MRPERQFALRPVADIIGNRNSIVMRTIIIDCAGVRSSDEFWTRYLDATRPDGAEHFGRNLDAFWDAIEKGGPGWPGEVALDFRHVESLAWIGATGEDSLLDGLRKVAEEATFVGIQLS